MHNVFKTNYDDAQWEIINKNQRPLELYSLIERVVMQQTGDEYPPNNLVDNLLAVLTLKQQNNQTNTQWYEKQNTQVDVTESVVGVRCLFIVESKSSRKDIATAAMMRSLTDLC